MGITASQTFIPHNAVEYQQIQLLHQIQNQDISNTNVILLSFFMSLPLPVSWRLGMYNFFSHLPIPELSPMAITILLTVGPIITIICIYLFVKGVIYLSKTLIPLVLGKFMRNNEEKKFLELTFPSDTSKSAYATEQLYKTIHTIAQRNTGIFSPIKTFSLEIVSTRNEGIRYIIGIPKADINVIRKSLMSYLPGLMIREISDYLEDISHTKTTKSVGVVEFKLSDDFVLPLIDQKTLNKHDSIAYLTGSMTKLAKGEVVALQIVTKTPVGRSVRDHIGKVKNNIYQSRPLSDTLFKKTLPFPPLLLFILSPFLWILLAIFKLAFHLPYLFLSPNGSETKSYFNLSHNTQTNLNPYDQELSKIVKEKLASHLFEVSLRVLIVSNTDSEFDARHTGIVASLSQFSSPYQSFIQKAVTKLPFLSTREFNKRLEDFQERNISNDPLILSSSELSDLYHFPNMDITKTEGMVKSKSGQLPAPLSMKRDAQKLDVIVGENIYGGEKTPIGLSARDRSQHTYIVGKTGMGKSTIIENMALQDIASGKGICVIDPHGDMIDDILTLIPKSRIKDVVHINPFDKSFPTGLNILNPGTHYEDLEEEHRRIASTVMSIFMKITAEKNWGQRMEHILRNAILTSLQIKPGDPNTPYISLFTIQKLLTDEVYRKSVAVTLSDPILKQFWDKEFKLFRKGQQGDIVAPLTNKIGEFITDPLTRHILLQKTSTINISDIMNEGKILLVNLSKGNLGEERSAFFGTIITSLIQLATYGRAEIPMDKRRDFFVYIDEFQNFATSHFTELFSEARKYHVYFTPSHQNIAQIDDPKVSKVIKGNSGNFIVLKGSSDDEKAMLPIFSPEVTEGQIVNLTPHHFFMKVTNDASEDAFSGVTMPITQKGSDKTKERIIVSSRKYYATPREEVEKQLKILFKIAPVHKMQKLKHAEGKTSQQANGVKKDAKHVKRAIV